MEQIPFLYLARVLVTILGGFFLAQSIISTKLTKSEGLSQFLDSLYSLINASATSRLILAFAAMLVGLISLIVGKFYMDFFPAVLAVIVAIIIFMEEYIKNNHAQNALTSFVTKYGIAHKSRWGLASLFIGLVHIFFVNVPWI